MHTAAGCSQTRSSRSSSGCLDPILLLQWREVVLLLLLLWWLLLLLL